MANPNEISQFFANTDFDFPNLQCKAGQPLPDKWQHRELVRRLQAKYGEDCVVRRVVSFRRENRLAVEESEPIKGEKASKKR